MAQPVEAHAFRRGSAGFSLCEKQKLTTGHPEVPVKRARVFFSAGAPSTPGFGVMGWSGSPLRQAARFQCWL